jgi:hypothetical protein
VSRSALLWLTHVWTPELQVEFETLSSMRGSGLPEVWLLMDRKTLNAAQIAARYPRVHLFDEAGLFRLPYPRMKGRGLIEHHHFPALDFFLQRPEYEFYWVMEYDVRYTGEWETFLSSYDECDRDFITSHLRRFDQEPGWEDWDSLRHPTKQIPREKRLRCFNVIHRISNRALVFIHESQVDGWEGFAEVSLPTLLLDGGFTLLDFGGDGTFTAPGSENCVYTSRGFKNGRLSLFATIRYRPARTKPGKMRNKIYHPVKPDSMTEPLGIKVRLFLRWLLDVAKSG